MTDLLVVSHACFTAINRSIYGLFLRHNCLIELVVPEALSLPSGSRKADPPRAGDPPIHYLPLQGDNPRTYRFEGLTQLLDNKKPAIVLLDNDPVSRMALQLGSWCGQNKSKLFCISCENLSLGIKDTIKRRGWKALPGAIAKRIVLMRSKRVTDGVFTINSDGKKIFTKEGFKKVEQIPLGFDQNYFFPDEHKRKNIRNQLGINKMTIAYFGRLIPEKGVHILISALKNLKQYDWKLMMDDFDAFASDYNRQIYDLLQAAGLNDRVIFIKPDHFEIAAYMNAADIIVVPSISTGNWKEQYGRVAAEAMACGKTVVASSSGSLTELLNNQGILFPEGDVPALTQVLEDLLTGSRYEEFQHRAPGIALYAKKALSIDRQKEIMETFFASA